MDIYNHHGGCKVTRRRMNGMDGTQLGLERVIREVAGPIQVFREMRKEETHAGPALRALSFLAPELWLWQGSGEVNQLSSL